MKRASYKMAAKTRVALGVAIAIISAPYPNSLAAAPSGIPTVLPSERKPSPLFNDHAQTTPSPAQGSPRAPVAVAPSPSAPAAPPVAAAPTNDFVATAQNACGPDIKKFCYQVTPGEGRTAACLKAHSDKLAPNCLAEWQTARDRAHANAKQEIKMFANACSSDAEKFCKESFGFKEISSCLNKHQSELSKGCAGFSLGQKTPPAPRSTG